MVLERAPRFSSVGAGGDLRGLDLNLLVTLEVLLAERNVTRAARRLGVTQSTLSHALSRLRDVFHDPLLVREGRAMVLTPRAEALGPELSSALRAVRAVFDSTAFEPRTATRSFVIGAPDLIAAFLPELVRAIHAEAPSVVLELSSPPGPDLQRRLADGSVDLALAPASAAVDTSLRHKRLGALHHVVLARRGHPALKGRAPLSVESWLAYPHIQVRTREGVGHLERVVTRGGHRRRIGVVVESFLLAPHVVADTDCFFTTPRELVRDLARQLGLVLSEPPVSVPPLPVVALWHERTHADAAHRWFRERVIGVIGRVLTTSQ
ncbi:MAG: LysR family transcriptional regulator [Polyangiaceae bacterium]